MPMIPVENCCGCTACCTVCPQKAVQMLSDGEGFVYPAVDLDKCITCGLCEQVCPILKPPHTAQNYEQSVVVQHKDETILDCSTSGGFIDALYYHVLEKKQGYAAGVAFDVDFMPEHMVTNQYEKAEAFRNSKYAQSRLDGVFAEIYELLNQGKLVMFVGTPCQVAGLKAFLRKEYDNLIAVDLVCRSIPSPKLWKAYLTWQEEKHKARIVSVACRRKTYGYHSGALEIKFANGKRYRGSNRVDYFMKSFHHDICSRPSCYRCKFKTEHRCSDFTVFDSWNPRQVAPELPADNDCGYSNVLVHTCKGKKILNELENIHIYQADAEKMFCYTGGMERRSIVYPEQRNTFYKDLQNLGFDKTVKKYVSVSLTDRLIELAKPVRYAIKKR